MLDFLDLFDFDSEIASMGRICSCSEGCSKAPTLTEKKVAFNFQTMGEIKDGFVTEDKCVKTGLAVIQFSQR